jgi:hypothetical protein
MQKPRIFDTYLLPAFLLFYAIKSKREMGRAARRILFTAGIYMAYRNYAAYKEALSKATAMLSTLKTGRTPV